MNDNYCHYKNEETQKGPEHGLGYQAHGIPKPADIAVLWLSAQPYQVTWTESCGSW